MDYGYIIHRLRTKKYHAVVLLFIIIAGVTFSNVLGNASTKAPVDPVAADTSLLEDSLSILEQEPIKPSTQALAAIETEVLSAQQIPEANTGNIAPVVPEESTPPTTPEITDPEEDPTTTPGDPVEEPAQSISLSISNNGCFVTAIAGDGMKLFIETRNDQKGGQSEHALTAREALTVSSGGTLTGMIVSATILGVDGLTKASATSTISADGCTTE